MSGNDKKISSLSAAVATALGQSERPQPVVDAALTQSLHQVNLRHGYQKALIESFVANLKTLYRMGLERTHSGLDFETELRWKNGGIEMTFLTPMKNEMGAIIEGSCDPITDYYFGGFFSALRADEVEGMEFSSSAGKYVISATDPKALPGLLRKHLCAHELACLDDVHEMPDNQTHPVGELKHDQNVPISSSNLRHMPAAVFFSAAQAKASAEEAEKNGVLPFSLLYMDSLIHHSMGENKKLPKEFGIYRPQ